MKKIILLLMIIFVSGCSAEYNLEYSDNTYKESLFINGNKNEQIDDNLFSSIINDYYNKNIIINYDADPGDIKNEDFPLYYNVYNKKIIDDNRYGLLLNYNYENKDDYIKSTIVNELFYDVIVDNNYIEMKSIKDVFSNYDYLESITIKFNTDKYIKSINADEKIDNNYYWYIDKDNYKNKNIYIIFADSRLDSIKSLSKENANKVIDISLLCILLFVLVFIIVIYSRIKKSNK